MGVFSMIYLNHDFECFEEKSRSDGQTLSSHDTGTKACRVLKPFPFSPQTLSSREEITGLFFQKYNPPSQPHSKIKINGPGESTILLLKIIKAVLSFVEMEERRGMKEDVSFGPLLFFIEKIRRVLFQIQCLTYSFRNKSEAIVIWFYPSKITVDALTHCDLNSFEVTPRRPLVLAD
jgi:hypothetical protein